MPRCPTYPLLLYPFRYRDARTGKWRQGRYKAELEVIRERYSDFEVTGEPMVVEAPGAGTFNPFRSASAAEG